MSTLKSRKSDFSARIASPRSVFLVFVFVLVTPLTLSAQSRVDSLLVLLPEVTDTARLDLLNEILGELARSNPDRALVRGEDVVEEASALGYSRGEGVALYWMGVAHYTNGDYETSQSNYEAALELLLRTDERDILGYVYNDLGDALSRRELRREAVEAYTQATSAHEASSDSVGWANAHNNIGLLYFRTSQYDSALAHYQSALDIREAMGRPSGVATVLNNMGVVLYQQGVYEGALERHLRSLRIRIDLRDERGAALVLNNIGKTYQDWGQLNEALESFEEGLERGERAGDASALGYSLHNLGTVHEAHGDIDQARDHYERSLEVYRTAGMPDGVAMNLTALGWLNHQLGQSQGAISRLNEAVDIATVQGNRERQARGLAYLGVARDRVGQSDRALRDLTRSLAITMEIGHRRLNSEVLGFLAEIHANRGELRHALEYMRGHAALRDSLFDEASGRRVAAMRANLEAQRQEQENAALRNLQAAQEATIARQRQGFILGAGLLVLAVMLAVVFYRARTASQQSNRLLAATNQALEEKNEALADALENVRTLKGFIPICSNCKKIRDDKGFWEQVETYVSKHSEAEFSHGICPDCTARLYPGLMGKKEGNVEGSSGTDHT